MKIRHSFLILFLLFFTSISFSQVTTIWEKSSAQSNYPKFMGTAHTERGFAYGKSVLQPVSKNWAKSVTDGNYPVYLGTSSTERGFAYGNNHLYVVSRKVSPNSVFVLDAANGDSLGALDITGISGGTFIINDAEVSDDGIIFVCNMTTNATTSAFKIYRWDTESSVPVQVVNYVDQALRLGDKFTVTGSTADNSIVIWAVGANTNSVIKFTTTDNGATFTPEVITLSDGNVGGSPAIWPQSDQTKFFINSNGFTPKQYLINGNIEATMDGAIVPSGSNAMRSIEKGLNQYIVVYNYGATAENLRFVDITGGFANAVLMYTTETLGTNSNGNGVGDVDVKDNGDGTYTAFIFSTNNGIASYTFNPQKFGTFERVYLASRLGGTKIIKLDAATGDSLGTLDVTGISGGTLPINDVEVSDDGQIFVCNLTTSASTSPFKVYKYDDEMSAPSVAVNYTAATALRLGDKITVTGSAADNTLTIWAVAGSSTTIVKFTTTDNGKTFTDELITLSDAACGSSPALWPMDTLLYVNGNGITPKKYKADGTFIEAVPSSIVSTGSNALRTFRYDGKDYLAVYNYGATAAENLRILDITNGLAAASLLHTTASLGSVANGNGAGDVDYKDNGDGTFTLFILGTNNGIASYKFQTPQQVMPVEFTPLAGTYYDSVDVTLSTPTLNSKIYYTLDGTTPDSATALLYSSPITLKDTTTIKAVAYADNMAVSDISFADYVVVPVVNVPDIATLRTSPTGPVYRLQNEAILTFQQSFRHQKYIQDTTGAILIDDNQGNITTEYSVGDGITGILGTTLVYGNMTEFVPVADPGVATSSNNVVEPQVITLADFKNNFEDYEAELVQIKNLTFIDGNGTNLFANGKIYKVTDGIDTVDFRTTFYDVDYIGEPIFSEVVNIVGLPNSRSAGNYLSARNLADFGIVPPEPMELYTYWAFNNRHGNIPAYFKKAGQNYERSAAYGKVGGKDRIYVVSRSGGPHIVVHDATNGAVIKEIAEPQPEVGLFPLNCVDVSEDGIIFACNMTLDATVSAPFTVYKWDSEDATPTIAFQYSGGGRMGDMFSVSGSVSDNSLVILTGIKDNAAGKVVKATTANAGASFDVAEITFTGLTQGTNPNFQVAADGTIWAKSYGKLLTHHNADGTIIDTVSGDIVATSASKIKYAKTDDGSEIVLVYYANVGASDKNEKVVGIDVTKGAKKAFVKLFTPVLGNVSNGNATGGVDFGFVNDTTFVVFVLGTNNGIGAYSSDKLIPTVHPYPAKDLVLSDGVGKNIKLKWSVQGGQDNIMTLNNGDALSGFYQLPNKAYGAIFDLTESPTAVVKELDFGHAGFDFFEGEAKYIVHAYNMDTQAEVFKSDTLVAIVAFPWEVKWETGIKLGNGISGVSKLGIFIEALTLDSFNNTWPTVMTDSQVPPFDNGQVVIDVTNPFVDIKNPSDNGLGNMLIDLWGTFTIPAKVASEPVQTEKAPVALSKDARKFKSSVSASNPRRTNRNTDDIKSAVSTFNIYRGTTVDDLVLIGTSKKNIMTYEDQDVADGTYLYAVSTVSVSGEESELITAEINHIGVGVEENIPATFMLSQNYPNPFNPATEIKFGLKVNSKVTLNVYNVIGEKVATLINKDMAAGFAKVSFNGANLASGIYFYRIEANGVDGSKFVDTKKMILIK